MYHKPTLRKVSGKTSWYVFVTKPDTLRKRINDKQARKSTGTSDKRLAEKLLHSIAEKIYREFDAQLKEDPFVAFFRKHWQLNVDWLNVSELSDYVDPLNPAPDAANKYKLVACEKLCYQTGSLNEVLADKLFQFLNHKEAKLWRNWISLGDNPYPVAIQQQQTDDELAQKALVELKEKNKILNRTGAPRLSEFLLDYQADEIRWRGIRLKEVQAQLNRLKGCLEIIGDIPVDQVLANHGILVAQKFDSERKSHSTIYAYVQSLRAYLNWIKNHRLNTYVSPPTPWFSHNPLVDLDLTNYGLKKRNYEAFTPDQLHRLFAIEMPKKDRLLLSILITTGMRLDEAALLTWEQYKIDRNGLRYFDLSVGAVIKNDKFSARTVAIPDCLALPDLGEGRLFNFKVDSDGKSSREASKHLRRYTHAVRYDAKDDRKVIHSLRHNLAGLMLNLRPTPSSEIMDWITGHGMEGKVTASVRHTTYGQDPDVLVKYEVVNRIEHPWLSNG